MVKTEPSGRGENPSGRGKKTSGRGKKPSGRGIKTIRPYNCEHNSRSRKKFSILHS